MRRTWAAVLLLTAAALGLRLFVAFGVTSDCSGDGPIYRQIALNVLDHGVYSADEAPPLRPTLIRMPGYPLTLAGIYALFGRGAGAVHAVQCAVDTATCWAAALLAFLWAPPAWGLARRRRAGLWAFVLTALCPFTMIYAGTLLTETWAVFLGTLFAAAATAALGTRGHPLVAWAAAGVLAGLACLFRPDMGLYAAAPGLILVLRGLRSAAAARGWRARLAALGPGAARGAVLSLAFAAVLAPWAVRNAAVFHLFQPLAPANAEMPGEFVPRGYTAWVKTWITRPADVEFFLWDLETKPLDLDRLPPRAFDSPGERERTAALFARYNGGLDNGPYDPGEAPDLTVSPALDGEFRALAIERIRRHPLRHTLLLPAIRAWNLWFDPHAAYTPVDGNLFPLSELDGETGQVVLLPLFYLLVWGFTILAAAGALALWRAPEARPWLLLFGLIFLPRLAFFAGLPNPEPRYMVELFPLVAALGASAPAAPAGTLFKGKPWNSGNTAS